MPTQPKAGAPRGNHNALKHGFYAKTFKPAERRELQAVRQLSLNAEIDMLRVVVRRVFDLTATLDDPIVALRYVHVLTRAVTSLDRLVARQNELHSERDEFDKGMHEALAELVDYKDQRRNDLRKRYNIQQAVLFRRLDSIIPPPPSPWPPPDPASLPQPDRELDHIDPYCSYYKHWEPEYYEDYIPSSPIGDRFDPGFGSEFPPTGYVHPDDIMAALFSGDFVWQKSLRKPVGAQGLRPAEPPPEPAEPRPWWQAPEPIPWWAEPDPTPVPVLENPVPAKPVPIWAEPAPPCGDPDVDADPLIDDPSTWDPDEEEGQILPPPSALTY